MSQWLLIWPLGSDPRARIIVVMRVRDDFEQTDQSNILFRMAMPNPKSPAIGSSTIQKRTTSITRKLLIRIAFISVDT